MRPTISATVFALSLLSLPAIADDVPAAIAAPGETLVADVHAVGAQVYQCAFDTAGNLVWQFREPVATLLIGSKTVGRHYAGPHWEMIDGSTLKAKVVGSAMASNPRDIPMLKLAVTMRSGSGPIAGTTTIQRLNTKGGVAERNCTTYGAFLSVPYTADYAFFQKR